LRDPPGVGKPCRDKPETTMRYALDGLEPEIDPTAWIAPTAVVLGRCRIEADASLWFGAVVRGDNELITIGRGSNVQENCVLHTDPGFPLVIAAGVTVGHLAMLHGCEIGEGSLIGIGATVMNGARIGKRCLIGAHAFIPEGKEIPDDSLVMGAPGKIVRAVTAEQAQRMAAGTANYVERARSFRERLQSLPAADDGGAGG
jgi:carbonic anhydrase/acetyltransferase-like protein (isoleucine patch superfamily)